MKIKVKEITPGCKFEVIKKGDWIDLRAAENVKFRAPQAMTLKRSKTKGDHRDVVFDFKLIPLGIAMALPKGYEAHISPRSGTYKNYGIIQPNSTGVVDYTYCGDNDEWKMPAVGLEDSTIGKGDRVCQFRIQLSQKATMWQKIKWLFSSKIEFVWVDKLSDEDRGGFGSTGVK